MDFDWKTFFKDYGFIVSWVLAPFTIIGVLITLIVNWQKIKPFYYEYYIYINSIAIIIFLIILIVIFIINKKKFMNYIKTKQKSLSEKYLLKHYQDEPEIQKILKDPITFKENIIKEKQEIIKLYDNEKQELLEQIKLKENIIFQYNSFNLDKIVFNIDSIKFEIMSNQLKVSIRLIYHNYNNLIEPIKIEKTILKINELNIEEDNTDILNIDKDKDYLFSDKYLKFKINLDKETTTNPNTLTSGKIKKYFTKDLTINNCSIKPFRIMLTFEKDGKFYKSFVEEKTINLQEY